jgi:predicted TIM-barrel fold metal-dependent hydrolase
VSGSGRFDVHAHYLPESYRAALLDNGHSQPDGFPQIPEWSAEEHVAMMDRLGIATSLLSISSPGVHFGDEAATADRAREVNEAGQRAVVDHPGRFGLFASLPLPDVGATVAEIAYCCDRLDVAGFTLLTNIGGTYLGDPAFRPVFDELDRRGARLFIHPTSPACWEHTSLGRPRPMLEFFFDTTRAVVDLVLNGTVAQHSGIEFLIPHAGATLAMVADRVSVFSLLLGVDPEVDVLRDVGRLHFDLAGFPLPRQLDALLTLTTLEHLHYGSDYPFTPEFAVAMANDRLAEAGEPPGSLLDALRANTQHLFPALATDRYGAIDRSTHEPSN